MNEKFGAKNIFQAILDFIVIFLGSFAIGSSMGCANALLTKFTYIKKHQTLETCLFILISYSAFLAAEAAEFTGIRMKHSELFCITIFFFKKLNFKQESLQFYFVESFKPITHTTICLTNHVFQQDMCFICSTF